MPEPSQRPATLTGYTRKVLTGCGNLYVTVNGDPPFEIFTILGKAGGCQAAQLETAARLISWCLRSGVGVEEIVDQLKGIQCPAPVMFPKEERVLSCADAIAKVLAEGE